MFKNEIEVPLSNEKRRSDFESKLTSEEFEMCRLTSHGEAVTAFALYMCLLLLRIYVESSWNTIC